MIIDGPDRSVRLFSFSPHGFDFDGEIGVDVGGAESQKRVFFRQVEISLGFRLFQLIWMMMMSEVVTSALLLPKQTKIMKHKHMAKIKKEKHMAKMEKQKDMAFPS